MTTKIKILLAAFFIFASAFIILYYQCFGKKIFQKKQEFFVIHDSSNKILDTIKSRCVQFNIFFNEKEKITIFNHLLNKYHHDIY